MRKLLLLIVVCIFCSWIHQSWADENKLPKVVLLTASKVCRCTLLRCQQAEALFDGMFKSYKGKAEFEKIDFSTDPQKAKIITKEYKVFMLPAALFFDKHGEFKGKLDGQLTKENIDKRLKDMEKQDG